MNSKSYLVDDHLDSENLHVDTNLFVAKPGKNQDNLFGDCYGGLLNPHHAEYFPGGAAPSDETLWAPPLSFHMY